MSSTLGLSLLPREHPWDSRLLETDSNPGHITGGRIKSTKKLQLLNRESNPLPPGLYDSVSPNCVTDRQVTDMKVEVTGVGDNYVTFSFVMFALERGTWKIVWVYCGSRSKGAFVVGKLSAGNVILVVILKQILQNNILVKGLFRLPV